MSCWYRNSRWLASGSIASTATRSCSSTFQWRSSRRFLYRKRQVSRCQSLTLRQRQKNTPVTFSAIGTQLPMMAKLPPGPPVLG